MAEQLSFTPTAQSCTAGFRFHLPSFCLHVYITNYWAISPCYQQPSHIFLLATLRQKVNVLCVSDEFLVVLMMIWSWFLFYFNRVNTKCLKTLVLIKLVFLSKVTISLSLMCNLPLDPFSLTTFCTTANYHLFSIMLVFFMLSIHIIV